MIERLAGVLRGDRVAADALHALEVDAVDALVDAHGVGPLLLEALSALGLGTTPLVARLQEQARRHAAMDLVREEELRRFASAAADRRLPVLAIKGAHLAYAVYPRPDLRPRLDTDVLVGERDRERASDLLVSLGYEPVPQAGGDLVSYQAAYAIRREGGIANVVDLHWRIANPQAFGAVFAYDDLDESAVPLPQLGDMRVPGRVHALLVACLHRVAHHVDYERLIWIKDLELLARSFEADDWACWIETADRRAVGRVCRQELQRASALLGAPVPPGLLADRRFETDRARSAPSAAFLGRRRHAGTVLQDLRLLPTWTARARLARQHLLPPSDYMRRVWAPASSAPLPWLYARRAWRGARRWLVRR